MSYLPVVGLRKGRRPKVFCLCRFKQLCLFKLNLSGMFWSSAPVWSWVTFCDAHSNSTLCASISICSFWHICLFFDGNIDFPLRGVYWFVDTRQMFLFCVFCSSVYVLLLLLILASKGSTSESDLTMACIQVRVLLAPVARTFASSSFFCVFLWIPVIVFPCVLCCFCSPWIVMVLVPRFFSLVFFLCFIVRLSYKGSNPVHLGFTYCIFVFVKLFTSAPRDFFVCFPGHFWTIKHFYCHYWNSCYFLRVQALFQF